MISQEIADSAYNILLDLLLLILDSRNVRVRHFNEGIKLGNVGLKSTKARQDRLGVVGCAFLKGDCSREGKWKKSCDDGELHDDDE